MMAHRRLRGDAPEQAQIVRLASSATGRITLEINGKAGVQVESWNATAIAAAWNSSILPEFQEITATADGNDVLLTADTPGMPFEVRGLVNGETTADEEQFVTISPIGAGGTFPLTFDGQTAADIPAGALPSVVKAALVALSNLGPDDIEVTGEPGAWRIRFTGTRADTNQPLLLTSRDDLTGGDASVLIETAQNGASGSGSPLLVIEERKGVAGTNEVQRFRFISDPGTLSGIQVRWRLATVSSGYIYSALFAADADLSVMQAALEAFSPSANGNVSLSGTLANSWSSPTNGVEVEFINAGASTSQVQYELTVANGPATIANTTVANGLPGTNEIQGLFLNSPPVGTGYRLKIGSQVTRQIAWDEDAGSIRRAINQAFGSTSGFSGVVDLPIQGPYNQDIQEKLGVFDYANDGLLYFEFNGPGYQSTDVPLMEVVGVGSNEIQAITISPNCWQGAVTLSLSGDDAAPLNWDATASEAQEALEDLPAIGAGNVTCYGGPWPVSAIFCEFDASLGNLPQLTATHTLTNATISVSTIQQGGAAVQASEIQSSRGPLHWDDPRNWSDDSGAPGVPGSGDTVTVENAQTSLLFGLLQRSAFTVNTTTNRLTLATGRPIFAEGQAVSVRSTLTLPGGLSAGELYYVVNSNGPTLQLAASPGGDPIDLTSSGSGALEVGVHLAKLILDSRFTGALGLPRWNDGNYDEYRTKSLCLWADEIEIGAGNGSGSGRLKLDTGHEETYLEIITTGGSREAGVPALLWQGTHPANEIRNVTGDIGVALFPEDEATVARFVQFGGQCLIGRNVTVERIRKMGGTLQTLGTTVNGEVFQS